MAFLSGPQGLGQRQQNFGIGMRSKRIIELGPQLAEVIEFAG